MSNNSVLVNPVNSSRTFKDVQLRNESKFTQHSEAAVSRPESESHGIATLGTLPTHGNHLVAKETQEKKWTQRLIAKL